MRRWSALVAARSAARCALVRRPPTSTAPSTPAVDAGERHHDGRLRLVPDVGHDAERRARRVHRVDRHRRAAGGRRRRRHDGHQGQADRRQPGGRRDVGRRQHAAVARRSTARCFEPYRSAELAAIDPQLTALVPGGEATPVDFGDVCVNYDAGWFADKGIAVPDVARRPDRAGVQGPARRQNPGTSSPGLAFLLATIAQQRRRRLAGLLEGAARQRCQGRGPWTTAYYDDFSGPSGATGDRPLVVSLRLAARRPRCSAPTEPPATAPTGVDRLDCFRQVEFAGVLRGTEHAAEARQLIDFLVGERSRPSCRSTCTSTRRAAACPARRVHQVRRRARPSR